jgi:hypothetical protein
MYAIGRFDVLEDDKVLCRLCPYIVAPENDDDLIPVFESYDKCMEVCDTIEGFIPISLKEEDLDSDSVMVIDEYTIDFIPCIDDEDNTEYNEAVLKYNNKEFRFARHFYSAYFDTEYFDIIPISIKDGELAYIKNLDQSIYTADKIDDTMNNILIDNRLMEYFNGNNADNFDSSIEDILTNI